MMKGIRKANKFSALFLHPLIKPNSKLKPSDTKNNISTISKTI